LRKVLRENPHALLKYQQTVTAATFYVQPIGRLLLPSRSRFVFAGKVSSSH